MNKRWIAGCLVMGVFACLCGAVAAFATTQSALGGARQSPGSVAITVTAPEAVRRNEPFAIEVVVQNRMAEPQTIDSIDISRDYLAAITLEEAVPAFTEALTIPLVGFESFTFLQTIPPNGRTTITLIMSGAEEGTFAGELDVCVNSGNVCQLFPLETTIGGG